jgi:hypothetical protein
MINYRLRRLNRLSGLPKSTQPLVLDIRLIAGSVLTLRISAPPPPYSSCADQRAKVGGSSRVIRVMVFPSNIQGGIARSFMPEFLLANLPA